MHSLSIRVLAGLLICFMTVDSTGPAFTYATPSFESQAVVESSWIAKPIQWIQTAKGLRPRRLSSLSVNIGLILSLLSTGHMPLKEHVVLAQSPQAIPAVSSQQGQTVADPHRLQTLVKAAALKNPAQAVALARQFYGQTDPLGVSIFEQALTGKSMTRAAGRWLSGAQERYSKTDPPQQDFYLTVYILSVAAQMQDRLTLFSPQEFSDLIQKIIRTSQVGPGMGADFNFNVSSTFLKTFQGVNMHFVIAHEVAHNWIYGRSSVLAKNNQMELKAVDELIADTVALAWMERLGLVTDARLRTLLTQGDLCVSCQLAPGEPILWDEAGRVLLLQLIDQPSAPRNRWGKMFTSMQRNVERIRPETTFIEFSKKVLQEAGIPFSWTKAPWSQPASIQMPSRDQAYFRQAA